MSVTPPIDPAAIAQLREINPDDGGEFVRELVGIFLADTPQRIAEIESSLAAADAKTLTRAAHSIKGSAGNFGATALAAAALGIENQGKASDLAGAQGALPHLKFEYDKVRVALEAVLASL
jgi:HPt (histidine-containing phosphotransfer) domain-containing protein